MVREILFTRTASGKSFLVESPRLRGMISRIVRTYDGKTFYGTHLLDQIFQDIAHEEIGRQANFMLLHAISAIIVLVYPLAGNRGSVGEEKPESVFQIVLAEEIIELLEELAKIKFVPKHPSPEAIRVYEPSTIEGQLANFIVAMSYNPIY